MDSKGVYALITLFNLKPIIDSRLIMLRRWYKLKSLKERYIKILKIQAFTKVEENILGENKIIPNLCLKSIYKRLKLELGQPNKHGLTHENIGIFLNSD